MRVSGAPSTRRKTNKTLARTIRRYESQVLPHLKSRKRHSSDYSRKPPRLSTRNKAPRVNELTARLMFCSKRVQCYKAPRLKNTLSWNTIHCVGKTPLRSTAGLGLAEERFHSQPFPYEKHDIKSGRTRLRLHTLLAENEHRKT